MSSFGKSKGHQMWELQWGNSVEMWVTAQRGWEDHGIWEQYVFTFGRKREEKCLADHNNKLKFFKWEHAVRGVVMWDRLLCGLEEGGTVRWEGCVVLWRQPRLQKTCLQDETELGLQRVFNRILYIFCLYAWPHPKTRGQHLEQLTFGLVARSN